MKRVVKWVNLLPASTAVKSLHLKTMLHQPRRHYTLTNSLNGSLDIYRKVVCLGIFCHPSAAAFVQLRAPNQTRSVRRFKHVSVNTLSTLYHNTGHIWVTNRSCTLAVNRLWRKRPGGKTQGNDRRQDYTGCKDVSEIQPHWFWNARALLIIIFYIKHALLHLSE